MSQPSCDACSNLREYAPEFVFGGVTSRVAASLKNNTGFNPSATVIRNNCEDLNDANDCIIGRKVSELDSLDVCDIKDFMSDVMPNMYEMLKAIIMSQCGQWDMISTLCEMVHALAAPPLITYGIFPYAEDAGSPRATLGVKSDKLTIRAPSGSVDDVSHGVGLRYGRVDVQRCDGGSGKEILEWINVFTYETEYAGVSDGDVVWSVDKASAKNIMGMSDWLWKKFTDSQWVWNDHMITSDKRFARFMLKVGSSGRLEITYKGSSYPNGGIVNSNVDATHGGILYRHYE